MPAGLVINEKNFINCVTLKCLHPCYIVSMLHLKMLREIFHLIEPHKCLANVNDQILEFLGILLKKLEV